MNESGMGGWLFVIIILIVVLGAGGNLFGIGGNNATMAGYATVSDINAAIAAQTSALNQQSVLLSSANNNYETSRLIDQQSMNMMNQNNTNLLAAINGFNAVNLNMNTGFNSVNQNIADLGYKMDQCCCNIQRLILENRLQDAQIALQNAQNVAVNAEQSQYLLSQLGSFVPKTAAAAAYATK